MKRIKSIFRGFTHKPIWLGPTIDNLEQQESAGSNFENDPIGQWHQPTDLKMSSQVRGGHLGEKTPWTCFDGAKNGQG
jgi:hypothetical protein